MARRHRHDDLPFLTRAPVQQVHRGHVSLPADRVFADLAERPEGGPAWFSLARDCHYDRRHRLDLDAAGQQHPPITSSCHSSIGRARSHRRYSRRRPRRRPGPTRLSRTSARPIDARLGSGSTPSRCSR